MIKPGHRAYLIWPAFGLIGFVLFYPVLQLGLLSDDFSVLARLLLENKPGYAKSYFRPVTEYSFIADVKIFGLNTLELHSHNLLLHVANSCLVFFAMRSLLSTSGINQTRPTQPALTAAIFFLVLPTHTESVAWIVARGDLLVCLFSLLAILTSLKYIQKPNHLMAATAATMTLLALLSKEAALPLPFILATIVAGTYLLSGRKVFNRDAIILAIWVASAFGCYWVLRYQHMDQLIGSGNLNNWGKNTLLNGVIYTLKSFGLDWHNFNAHFYIQKNLIAISICIATIIAALLCIPRKIVSLNSILILLIVLSMIPIIHKGVHFHLIGGERYIYLASVFSCMILGLCLSGDRFRLPKTTIVILLVLGYSWKLNQNLEPWKIADRVTKDSLASISEQLQQTDFTGKRKHIIISGLPASYQGVYIFQRGIISALRYFTGPEVDIRNAWVLNLVKMVDEKPESIASSSQINGQTITTKIHWKPESRSRTSFSYRNENLKNYNIDGVLTSEFSSKVNPADYPLVIFCYGKLSLATECKKEYPMLR
jgi:hypothetical protein